MSIGLDRRIAVGGAEHKGRGDPNLDVRQIEVAGFVQTDWRINRRFTVFAGLRYQWQTNISDNDNFALIDAVDVDI